MISSLVLLLGIIFIFFKLSPQSEYQQHVKSFIKIDAGESEEKFLGSKDIVLYIGRETCPYCVQFVPILNEVSAKYHVPIYYLDTSNYEKDKSLQDFLKKHNVSGVPTLMIYSKGQLSFPDIPDSSDDLEKLFKSYGYQK
ncbi:MULTISPECIES: thioredoxin family protein [unclassified Granulicatella]|uniref:thioredoxin family protein n=1 Tax=unclassified Granulicatella TaxID=2630493 RepID=UPI001074601C|nr:MULTISPECIES: thioredoxin family protein [unclassified Granulicatella]MBF0780804.1 thioredoxin family protein [Granulicatella sp. 19428wC4_WM01]TFU93820.1 thioredoxin [Granulicatella sp. WM01]